MMSQQVASPAPVLAVIPQEIPLPHLAPTENCNPSGSSEHHGDNRRSNSDELSGTNENLSSIGADADQEFTDSRLN
jgi:hypothetical protein